MSAAILAVDGGQSGIRLQVSGSEKIIETHGASRLEGEVLSRVHDLIVEAVNEQIPEHIDLAVLGLTTSPSDKSKGLDLARRLGESLKLSRVLVTDDSVTHHASHFQGAPGVALAIGTGVACMSVGGDGKRTFSVSGYGYLLGDDGGAFSIGRNALRLVLDNQFLGPESELTRLAVSHFGPMEALAAEVHSGPRPVNAISQFARAVLELAETSQEALSIVNSAARDLSKSVQRAISAAGLNQAATTLSWAGRLFDGSSLATEALEKTLADEIPGLTIRNEASNPLAGAFWLGQVDEFGPYEHMIQVWKA